MNPEHQNTLALHILQRLGDGGVPPEHGIMEINVGNESYLQTLDEEYFQRLLRHGSAFKLVEGNFGAGKTHFLYCVRELAWKHGFAAALVELSPEECPYDDSFLTYCATARAISTAGRGVLAPPQTGIAAVLEEAIARHRRSMLQVVDPDDDWSDPPAAPATSLRDWLDDIEATPCESLSYRSAVIGLLEAILEEDRAKKRKLAAWLSGEPIPIAEVRPYGVYESMSRRNGFLMLRSLTQMLAAIGYAGTALLFDEVDRNISFSAKRTQTIGDNLRQVVDLCGRHQLPQTLFMYAVPPAFMQFVVPDYPALYQRLKAPADLGVRNPLSVHINLDDLDLAPTELLAQLGERITAIWKSAHGELLSDTKQRTNALLLAEACIQTQFDVNHRRLFVKLFVNFLDHQRDHGELLLNEESAMDLILNQYETGDGW